MKDWRMDEGRTGMNDTGGEASQLPDDGMNGDEWSREDGDGRMNKPEEGGGGCRDVEGEEDVLKDDLSDTLEESQYGEECSLLSQTKLPPKNKVGLIWKMLRQPARRHNNPANINNMNGLANNKSAPTSNRAFSRVSNNMGRSDTNFNNTNITSRNSLNLCQTNSIKSGYCYPEVLNLRTSSPDLHHSTACPARTEGRHERLGGHGEDRLEEEEDEDLCPLETTSFLTGCGEGENQTKPISSGFRHASSNCYQLPSQLSSDCISTATGSRRGASSPSSRRSPSSRGDSTTWVESQDRYPWRSPSCELSPLPATLTPSTTDRCYPWNSRVSITDNCWAGSMSSYTHGGGSECYDSLTECSLQHQCSNPRCSSRGVDSHGGLDSPAASNLSTKALGFLTPSTPPPPLHTGNSNPAYSPASIGRPYPSSSLQAQSRLLLSALPEPPNFSDMACPTPPPSASCLLSPASPTLSTEDECVMNVGGSVCSSPNSCRSNSSLHHSFSPDKSEEGSFDSWNSNERRRLQCSNCETVIPVMDQQPGKINRGSQVDIRMDEEWDEEDEDDMAQFGMRDQCPYVSRILFEQFIRVFCISLLG